MVHVYGIGVACVLFFFLSQERVPSLVTFETEHTWAPGRESAGSPPLDVASYLHFVSVAVLRGWSSRHGLWHTFREYRRWVWRIVCLGRRSRQICGSRFLFVGVYKLYCVFFMIASVDVEYIGTLL